MEKLQRKKVIKLINEAILASEFLSKNEQKRYEQRFYESFILENEQIVEENSNNADVLLNIENNNFELNNKKEFIISAVKPIHRFSVDGM